MPNSASVFDSWPLMAFLQDEPSAPQIEDLINRAHVTDSPLLITTVNLGEVWYSLARSRSVTDADAAVDYITRLKFEFVDVDWALTRQAAMFKTSYRLSYADCFAAALAKLENVELVTGNRAFKPLAREIKIHWV